MPHENILDHGCCRNHYPILRTEFFIGCPETSVKVTRTRCVIHCLRHMSPKNAVLIYFAADAWKLVTRFCFSIISLRRKSYRLRSDIHLHQLVIFHPTHLYQCYTFCSTICLSHGKFVPKDVLKFTRLPYPLSL